MGPDYRISERADSVTRVIAVANLDKFQDGEAGAEHTINCLMRALHEHDGYRAAKSLEDDNFDVDSGTVEDLENMIADRYGEAQRQTAAKIMELGLKPKYQAGQRVQYRRSRLDEPAEGVINKVIPETLDYLFPGLTPNSQWIIKEEDILNVCA